MKAQPTAKTEPSHQRGNCDHGGAGDSARAMVVSDLRPEMQQQQDLLSLAARGPRVQRTCECGASRFGHGRCTAVQTKPAGMSSLILQKKLAIGAVDDPLEREADHVADQVIAGLNAYSIHGVAQPMRASAQEGDARRLIAPASVEQVLASSGFPLESSLRSDMERRFGYDFSRVRVHADADAEQSAREVNAKAYTVGDHIVFGRRRYSPGTPEGMHLLAHELTHVVQQSSGAAKALRRDVDQRELDKCMASLGDTSQQGKGHVVDRDAGVASANEIELYKRECTQRLENADRERRRSERVADALRRSGKYGSLSGEIMAILNDPFFRATLVVGIAAYLSLWVVPEPVISKLTAIITTIAILGVGGFSASTIYNLASAWARLEAEAGDARSDEEIEAAAEHFGNSITAIEAQLLVFLASIILGRVIPGPKGRLPPPEEAVLQAKAKLNSTGREGVVAEGSWGRARATQSLGSGSAGRASPRAAVDGNLALKIETHTQPAPKMLPLSEAPPVAANDNALPLPANDNASAAAAARGSKPIIPLIPGQGAKESSAEKLDPKKFYPLYWSPLLPPVTSRVFVRTPGRERDTRKAAQASMQQQWRQFRDPDFKAKWVHVHHVIPLFLGGQDDLVSNGMAWTARVHLKGHRDLRIQPQMQTPPNGLPPLAPDLYAHPAGTLYVLAGYKGAPGAPASIGQAFNEPGDPPESEFDSE